MNLRHLRALRWLTAFAVLVTLITIVGAATAAANTDMYDPDVRLSDGFFPPAMGNALIVTSTCAPNNDLSQPSTVTISSRSSGSATIPGAPFGGWVNGSLTWQLTANIGGQTNAPVAEFWPFTIDGAPTGSHGLATGPLTSLTGQFSIDRGAPGASPEDIAGTLSLGSGGGNWGVCRSFANEQPGGPNFGPGWITGKVHSLHGGSLTYTVTQGPAGLLGETGDAAGTLMNSYATGNGCQIPCGSDYQAIATGHFRLEFGTTIPAGGSQATDPGTGVAPVTVEPMPDVTITFSDVTAGGPTNVVQTTDAPTLPGGFQLANGLFYEIKTNAAVVFPATVCFPAGGLALPEILHFEGGVWVPVTTDVVGDQVCGEVNSLSPFAVGTSQIYDVSGPFQPVDAFPTVNTMKAGRSVPVKFKLGGDYGLDVFADGYPKAIGGDCSASVDPVETTTTNVSGLIYDATTGVYTYNWKTSSSWKGQCRTLILQFSDGQELKANFSFN